MFDSFDIWEFSFLDPNHEFLRIFSFVWNFLYLIIKKILFEDLNHFLENFPIVQLSWISISFQRILTVFIPSQFQIFVSDVVCIISEFLYNAFKIFFIVDMNSIELFDWHHDFLNKFVFFFIIYNCMFSDLNIFFEN